MIRNNKLIIKPSIVSGAGQNILVFEKKGKIFTNNEYDLNPVYLDKYSIDFVIQEFIPTFRDILYQKGKWRKSECCERCIRTGDWKIHLDFRRR